MTLVHRWAASSDVGHHRRLNEDAYLARAGLFVVADGMGGHAAGEVASGLAVETLERLPSDRLPSVDEVAAALAGANAVIVGATGTSEGAAMGTTAVGLALVDNGGAPWWAAFNVGDSRLYRWFDRELRQLSVDHSYVRELIEAGQLTEDAARRHPHRNVVTRALGSDATVDPDYWLLEPAVGEWFLLCSDGLTGELDDVEIGELLGLGGAPDDVVGRLMHAALARGAHDNVTVLVVEVLADDSPAAVDEDIAYASPIETDTMPSGQRRAVADAVIADVPVSPSPAAPAPPEDADLIDHVPASDGADSGRAAG